MLCYAKNMHEERCRAVSLHCLIHVANSSYYFRVFRFLLRSVISVFDIPFPQHVSPLLYLLFISCGYFLLYFI